MKGLTDFNAIGRVHLFDFSSRIFRRWTQYRTHARVAVEFPGKFRRFFLVHFRPRYVARQVTQRTGSCRRCGRCCALLFTCPMLTCDGLCLAYGRCRPSVCRVFPIDSRDIAEIARSGGKCGFRFDPPKGKYQS